MKRIVLPEKDIPERWYNIVPDLPAAPAPYLHPVTLEPLQPDDLVSLLPRAVIEQEMSPERWIDIPEEVRKIYAMWRPTPLCRAERLERA